MKQEKKVPLIRHLVELRRVLMISAYAVAFGAVIGWLITPYVFEYLTRPVASLSQTKFVTTSITEPIMVKLEVSLLIGIVVALPIIIWQIWSFISPGLKKHERKYVYLILPFSILLFWGGAAFAFFIVLPIGLRFLLFVNSGVKYEPLITQASYVNFLLKFVLVFGLVFEMPVVLVSAVRFNLLTPKWLKKKRRYAIFIIVVLVAFISPTPDILSQLLMSGPMYLLYEGSIWLSYLAVRDKSSSSKRLKGEDLGGL